MPRKFLILLITTFLSFQLVQARVTEISFDELTEIVERDDYTSVIIVDCYATWCAPCAYYAPTFDNVSGLNLPACFYRIDIDENQEMVEQLNIESIPTTLVIYRAEDSHPVVVRKTGMMTYEDLKDFVIEGIRRHNAR